MVLQITKLVEFACAARCRADVWARLIAMQSQMRIELAQSTEHFAACMAIILKEINGHILQFASLY